MNTTYYLIKYSISSKGEIRTFATEKAPSGHSYVFEPGTWNSYKIGRDLFTTPEDAIAAAEVARKKKIVSLRKQITALEKLEFRVEGGAA